MKRFSCFVAFVVAATACGSTFGQGADDCASAQDITGLTTITFDTTTATSGGVVAGAGASCAGTFYGMMNQDVWFSWTAPDDGQLALSVCGLTTVDTDLSVFSGTCATPTEIACSGDGAGAGCGLQSELTAQVQTGATYLIQLGGWDATEFGTGSMSIGFTAGLLAPANLNCTVDPGTGIVTATFDLLDTYDNVFVYVDAVVVDTIATPPSGANTWMSSALAGGTHTVCFEAETASVLSSQSCCTVYVPIVCPPSDGTLSPIAPTIGVGSVQCGAAGFHADNSYIRGFNLTAPPYSVTDSIRVTCVTIGIEDSTSAGTQPVRVRLHYDLNGGEPTNLYAGAPYTQPATAEMFYEEEFQVPDLTGQLYTFVLGSGLVNPDGIPGLSATPEPGCLALQSSAATLVVEIFTPDGGTTNGFFIGSSTATTQTGGSYIYAPACGLTAPVSTATIGFPTNRYIMDIDYDIVVPGICTGTGGVSNLVCDQVPATTTADVSWTNAGGAASWVVEVDGTPVATLAGAVTTYTTGPLTPYTVADITVTAYPLAGGGGTALNFQSCAVNVAPVNNWLAGALAVSAGVTPFDITTAVNVQGPALDPAVCDFNIGDQQIWNDLYYCYTAAVTGDVVVSTCSGTTFDTRLAVYVGNCLSNAPADVIACNDDAATGATTPGGTLPGSANPACTNFAAELTFAATSGTTYLIRLGTFNAAGLGSGGELTINDCLPPQGLAATYDCASGDVDLSWTTNPLWTGITIERDNVLIATLGAGATTYTDANAPDGDHLYEVISDCGGGPNASPINVSTLKYDGQTDLVFAMEGLQSAGDVGANDGGPELLQALVNNLRDAALIRSSILDYSCVSDPDVENVWILTGTFPDDYRLDMAEGDLVGTLGSSGKNIYFEGGDHWGFVHVASGFDARDGIDDASYDAGDGDDTFDGMDGLSGAGLDLLALQNIPYTDDQTTTSDYTDQLVAATADGAGPNAAPVWRIDDALAAGAYNTTIAYDTNAGGKTISSSWELGGYGGVLDDLVADYLDFFSPPVGGPGFKRGDANNDNGVNIADAVYLLGSLFPPPGGTANVLACRKTGDGNDDGGINIADAVAILASLFGSPAVPLPAPNGVCGVDPTADALDCLGYLHCP